MRQSVLHCVPTWNATFNRVENLVGKVKRWLPSYYPISMKFSKEFLFRLFTTRSRLSTTLRKTALKNTVGKGERFPAFSPFPTMFSTLSQGDIIILATFYVMSANAFNFVQSKF